MQNIKDEMNSKHRQFWNQILYHDNLQLGTICFANESNLLRLALVVHLLDIPKDSDQSEVSNWNQFNFYKIQSSPVHLVEVQLIMSKYYYILLKGKSKKNSKHVFFVGIYHTYTIHGYLMSGKDVKTWLVKLPTQCTLRYIITPPPSPSSTPSQSK